VLLCRQLTRNYGRWLQHPIEGFKRRTLPLDGRVVIHMEAPDASHR
jgi:hypothetical protein